MDSYVLVLLALATLLPAFSAALCYVIRNSAVRNFVVVVNTLVLFYIAWEFTRLLIASNGSIRIDEHALPFNIGEIIKYLDVLLLGIIGYYGFRLKKPLILTLTALQLVPVIIFEFFMTVPEPATLLLAVAGLAALLACGWRKRK